MVAIDLDGTLLAPDGSVTPRNKAAVHQALSAGLVICFATGRNWTESQPILESVGHFDTAVFVSGAMVIDTRQRKTLHKRAMEPALAREVCEILESLGQTALVLQDTAEVGTDYLVTADVELNQATSQWMRVTSAVVHRVSDLATRAHEHTIRVGIVAAADDVAQVRQTLQSRLGQRVVCHSLYVPAYAVEVLEVFDPAVNKWQGLLHAAGPHGIRAEQIVAIGDDLNDLQMIAKAGLGVAMGNAKPEVQAAAKRIIRGNHEDGLAEFLEELVAGQIGEAE
jgi:hypothetical protein